MDLPLFDLVARQNAAFRQTEKPQIRNEDGKRAEILLRLQQGPLSTFDAERLVHRGQAVIGALRNEGHQIELQTIGNASYYVYQGYRRLVKVTPELQEAYYKTEHWRKVSRERKLLDNWACRQCFTDRKLETHHWRYRLFKEDVREDLITLCVECHAFVHDVIKGSCVHFPRSVDESIARRIMEES